MSDPGFELAANVSSSTVSPTVSPLVHAPTPAANIPIIETPTSIVIEADPTSEHHAAVDLTGIDGDSLTSADEHLDGAALELVSQTPCPSMVSPAMQALSEQVRSFRIFLDICSGSTRPLSQALIALHADVISFDILLDQHMDLLDDHGYEALLKLCASGAVAYAAASPSCSQYSRLKLRMDSGPPPLRTPEFLQGVPGLGAADLAKVQTSYTVLSRCLTCLSVVHSSGGHVHLEQPSSAMSWLEPETQSFIRSIGHHCINVAACHFGKNWHKNWMFSSSLPTLTQLGCTCPHPPGSHEQVAGRTNQAGDFFSRDTACYPDMLASRFAEIIAPLLSSHAGDISWNARKQIIPIKSR